MICDECGGILNPLCSDAEYVRGKRKWKEMRKLPADDLLEIDPIRPAKEDAQFAEYRKALFQHICRSLMIPPKEI